MSPSSVSCASPNKACGTWRSLPLRRRAWFAAATGRDSHGWEWGGTHCFLESSTLQTRQWPRVCKKQACSNLKKCTALLEAAVSARSGVVPMLSARVRRTIARGAGAWNKLLLFCGSCRRRLARDCGGAPQLAALQFPGDIAQHDATASPFILHWPQIFGAAMCHGSLGELTTSASPCPLFAITYPARCTSSQLRA